MSKSDLKKSLLNNEMVLCGGVWDSLSAIIEEKAGFKAVKLGSSQMNASLGLPDLGLVTAAEVRDRIYNIAGHIEIPLVVDFESGFGSEKDFASAAYWARMRRSLSRNSFQMEFCVWKRHCIIIDILKKSLKSGISQ